MPGEPDANTHSPPNREQRAEPDLSEDEQKLLADALAILRFDAKAAAQAGKDLKQFERDREDTGRQLKEFHTKAFPEALDELKETEELGREKMEPWLDIRHDPITAARHTAYELYKSAETQPPGRREQFEARAELCLYPLARAAILEIVDEARQREEESKRSPRPKEVRTRLDTMILAAGALLKALPGSSEDLGLR